MEDYIISPIKNVDQLVNTLSLSILSVIRSAFVYLTVNKITLSAQLIMLTNWILFLSDFSTIGRRGNECNVILGLVNILLKTHRVYKTSCVLTHGQTYSIYVCVNPWCLYQPWILTSCDNITGSKLTRI